LTYGYVELGSFDEVMSSVGCQVHPSIFRSYFGDTLDTAGVINFTASRTSDDVNLSGHISPSIGSLYAWRLTLLSTPTGAHTTRRAKSVDQNWIDHNLLRRWKRRCDEQNHEVCQQGPASTRLSLVCPRWLIDTWRLCLVRGSPGAPYVALSYVWGKESFFKTTRQNVAELQLDFALTDAHGNLGVPRTIEDAIAVVGLLEERYLWVDALCIVQDDDTTRDAEIYNMAAIFAAASATIIANQGEDANYGLRGLRHISQPRTRSQDIFRPAKGYQIVQTRKQYKTASPWSKRGWTFQEGLLSRRRLVFENGGVRWQCAYSSFHEDVQSSRGTRLRDKDPLSSNDNMFSTSFPSLAGYSELLRDYNLRNFTYPQDALSAFAGITTALSRTFYGGFLCGLPLMFLDVALCWQPYNKECERRLPSENKEPTELGLPSWSWVGWKCEPDPWAWDNGGDYVKKSQSVPTSYSAQQTLPIVDWFSQKWGTTETKPIYHPQRTMQELKMSAMQGRDDLPSGWMRFDYTVDSEKKFRDDCLSWKSFVPPRYFYRHQCDPDSEFWYPIPICYDTQEGPSLHVIGNDTLLCGRTRRAWLCLKERLKVYHAAFSIRDSKGNWVGALRSQTPLLHESSKYSRDSQEMTACELVAMSAGYAIEGLDASAIDEWHVEERLKGSPGEKYEYYNVLWVEWKDGIAYRKGLGRVMKSAWEAQDLEWIDLVLG
jgi:hypothetical protein